MRTEKLARCMQYYWQHKLVSAENNFSSSIQRRCRYDENQKYVFADVITPGRDCSMPDVGCLFPEPDDVRQASIERELFNFLLIEIEVMLKAKNMFFVMLLPPALTIAYLAWSSYVLPLLQAG